MKRTRVGVMLGLLSLAGHALIACASKPPPPPVIETQEAELGQPSETASKALPDDGTQPSPVADGPAPVPVGGDPAPVPVGDTAGAASVSLLDAGAAPRRTLSHKFKKGSTERLVMKSKTHIKGASMPLPTITVDAPMEAKIVELNAAGEAKFQFKAGPFKTGTGGGGAMAGMLGGALGGGAPEKIAGWGWITPQGQVKEFHVEEGANDGDAPVEKGDPFPSEAVGVGARWQVTSTFEEKGVTVQQTSTYVLVKLDKKAATTQVSREQVPVGSADPSAAGAAKSSGQLVYHFGDVYPTGKLSMSRAMQLDLTGLGGGSPLTLSSDVTISKR
jgi:hypothetical protein